MAAERFFYEVHCAFEDPAVCDAWCAWLEEEHLADLVAVGALRAEVVRLGPLEAAGLYVFADRAAFDAYERDHAPRLRQEGLAKFPLALGLTYRRATGALRGPA